LKTGDIDVDTGKIFVPALACGVVAGLISFAMWNSPFDCLCCLLAVVIGGIAVYVVKHRNNIQGKITMTKAALTGGITGFVAGIVMSVIMLLDENIEVIVEEVMNQPEFQDALREAGIAASEMSGMVSLVIVILVIMFAVGFTLFGALGGIIVNEITK
jgi:hypothetical protein